MHHRLANKPTTEATLALTTHRLIKLRDAVETGRKVKMTTAEALYLCRWYEHRHREIKALQQNRRKLVHEITHTAEQTINASEGFVDRVESLLLVIRNHLSDLAD